MNKMTENIAFTLGQFNFPCFYSYALWKVNKEAFPLFRFFRWTMSELISLAENGDVNWEDILLYGKLKTEEIKTIGEKSAYIRGKISGHKKSNDNEITIYYANSYDFRDFLAKCIYDVLMDRYFEGKTFGPNSKLDIPFWRISKGEVLGTVPGTPFVTLNGDKEVIDYIYNL